MNPEEIDKLFRERLKNSAPTPPGDLWSRLQDRMEAELPQQPQEEKKEARGGFMVWVNNYAAAAAVTVLLSVGLGAYKYNLEKNKDITAPAIAQTEAVQQPKAEAPATAVPAEETTTQLEGIAAAPVQKQAKPEEATVTSETATPARSAKTIAKAATPKASATKATAPEREWKAEPRALAVEKPNVQPDVVKEIAPVKVPASTAVFASNNNLNAAPVEIMIKRTVATESDEDAAETSEASGLEKKQQLAKNIFKQVKNLANGESVELSELGIKAEKIALETQIGKQKFSKVINL